MPEPFPPCPGVTFRDVPGFPGYCVGDDGTVWSRRVRGSGALGMTWRALVPFPDRKSGGWQVGLRRDGKNHPRFIARLVLEAFVGLPETPAKAFHGPDPDLANNRLDNLAWGEPGGNSTGRARLTEDEVVELRRMIAGGEPRKVVARLFGLDRSTVDRIARMETWTYLPADENPGKDHVWGDWKS